jgi:predicted RNA-binding protein YlxR (DUF448 family)
LQRTQTSSNGKPVRHVPERTCIACRQVKAKRDMTRVVKSPDGVVVDESGRVSGRGAYLCKTKQCWEDGLKNNRLEYVLRTRINPEELKRLEEYQARL